MKNKLKEVELRLMSMGARENEDVNYLFEYIKELQSKVEVLEEKPSVTAKLNLLNTIHKLRREVSSLKKENKRQKAKVKELEESNKKIKEITGDNFEAMRALEHKNQRYKQIMDTASDELNWALNSGKPDDVKKFYTENAKRFLDEALEESE